MIFMVTASSLSTQAISACAEFNGANVATRIAANTDPITTLRIPIMANRPIQDSSNHIGQIFLEKVESHVYVTTRQAH